MSKKTVTPKQLRKMLQDGEEIALIDVREQGEFSKAHLLLACCIPLSRMELLVDDLIPRINTRMVLMDNGPSDPYKLAESAASRLSDFGYTDIAVLEGGVEGWGAAGFMLFSGVNVVSKAFGEFVEATYDTPRIPPEALRAKTASGETLSIFDARPEDEYYRMNIPDAVNVPGAELVYRFFDMAPDINTQIVVNCAGRTRSIIGAQSLINAGVPNPVVALKNGTMGWHLAGFDLEHGRKKRAPNPSSAGLNKALACAKRVAERFGVKRVDRSTLKKLKQETETRTLFILDVRSPEEFEAGHLIGSRNAPGGQLVQATDEYAAVRNARLVLVDDNEIRSTMTASWLIQMGWNDIFVLAGGIGDDMLEHGPHQSHIPGLKMGDVVSPEELKTILGSDKPVAVLDLATSRRYREAHIPGAWWGIRSRLPLELSRIPEAEQCILTSPDGTLAHLALKEVIAARPDLFVKVLDGGTDAWVEAGFPTDGGMTPAISDVDDVSYKPYEYQEDPEKEMRAYLDWEVALVEQIEKDGTVEFRRFN